MARRRSRCRRRERPTPLVEHRQQRRAAEGVTRLFARTGAGSASWKRWSKPRGLERRESASRKAIVALINENGPEFSNLYYANVLDALKRSGDAARAGDQGHAVGQ